MSDLQCPAKVVLIPRNALAVAATLPMLAGVNCAGVFMAAPLAADPSALAGATGLAQQRSCRLEILTHAVEGASLVRAVDDLADLYRGETIVVIAAADMLRDALGRARATTQPIVVSIDSSGWVSELVSPDG